VLALHGVKVGVIKVIGSTFDPICSEWVWLHILQMGLEYKATHQNSLEVMWRTLICDWTDGDEPPGWDWPVDFKEWIESQFIIKFLFPGWRMLPLGDIPSNEGEWWKFVRGMAVITDSIEKHMDYPFAPCARHIQFTAQDIQQHPEFPPFASLASSPDISPALWNKIFTKMASTMDEFRPVYNKALLARFPQRLNISLQKRRMFGTDGDLLGNGPLALIPGDEVWLLKGGRVPYVLRTLDEVAGTYTFLGDC
jgi:hypothetical protein